MITKKQRLAVAAGIATAIQIRKEKLIDWIIEDDPDYCRSIVRKAIRGERVDVLYITKAKTYGELFDSLAFFDGQKDIVPNIDALKSIAHSWDAEYPEFQENTLPADFPVVWL